MGLILIINTAVAQEEKELLAQIFEEDREVIEALVLYSKETRLAILETASSPQAIIKLKRIQSKTSLQFKTLLDGYIGANRFSVTFGERRSTSVG